MANRMPLRTQMLALAEEIEGEAQAVGDATLVRLARREIHLIERQYAGIERCLDELNHAEATQQTVRWQKAVAAQAGE